MSQQPESRLQRRIREALEAAFPNSWWVKIHGGPWQKSGIPDLIGFVDGLFFGFEVKMPGEHATPLQAATIATINSKGAQARVVYTPAEAVEHVTQTLAHLESVFAQDPAVADARAMQHRLAKMARRDS